LLTEIEARLDFEDEMPPLDPMMLLSKINSMRQEVQDALDTANYDKLLQSGLQVHYSFHDIEVLMKKKMKIETCIYNWRR
jgi:hypothetical protein